MSGPTPTCPRCMHTAHLPGPCQTPSANGCRECESEPTPTEKGQPADELLEYLSAHPEADMGNRPMNDLDLSAIRQRVEMLRTPLTEDARMEAYYYGFDRTGVGVVDAVLSAVAVAGKGSHSTETWIDDDYGWYYSERPGLPQEATSAVDLIQKAAARSAAQVAELSADVLALIDEVERLRSPNNPYREEAGK